MSEWKMYKLGKIAAFRTGKLNSNAEIPNGDYPFFTCSPTTLRINQYAFDCEALLLAGNNAEGNFSLKYYNGKFNAYQRTYVITIPDTNIIQYKYLYYSLILKIDELKNNSVGSATKFLTMPIINDIDLIAPSLPTQTQIAQILTSFDDKIELLGQMNQTLETMAQTIFKEWFVDFNFPGFDGEMVGGMPKGWRKEAIDKNIEFLNGLALQKFPPLDENDYLPVIKIREMRQGISNSSDMASTQISEKYIIEDGDILFSWSGSLDVVLWCGGKGALNQHLFKVTSVKYPKWFYYHWTKCFLPMYQSIASDKATTMGHIQRKHLTESLINIPDFEVLSKGNDILEPIIDKITNNSIQIQNLTQLRDTLLPKLMSGAVRVDGHSSVFSGDNLDTVAISDKLSNESTPSTENLRDTLLPKLMGGEVRVDGHSSVFSGDNLDRVDLSGDLVSHKSTPSTENLRDTLLPNELSYNESTPSTENLRDTLLPNELRPNESTQSTEK